MPAMAPGVMQATCAKCLTTVAIIPPGAPPPPPTWGAQPGAPPYGPVAQREPDLLEKMVPQRNPHALIAYYLGVFSFIPCLGVALAIPALILGCMGLKAAHRDPSIRGNAHAWTGIILGAIFTLVWGGLLIWWALEVVGHP
jgi:hypothetical protein